MYHIRANERETVSITIIDNSLGDHVQHTSQVHVETLQLMLKADYITVDGKTLTKESTRVDEVGNVYFHGFMSDVTMI